MNVLKSRSEEIVKTDPLSSSRINAFPKEVRFKC